MEKAFHKSFTEYDNCSKRPDFYFNRENILKTRLESLFFEWIILPESEHYIKALQENYESAETHSFHKKDKNSNRKDGLKNKASTLNVDDVILNSLTKDFVREKDDFSINSFFDDSKSKDTDSGRSRPVTSNKTCVKSKPSWEEADDVRCSSYSSQSLLLLKDSALLKTSYSERKENGGISAQKALNFQQALPSPRVDPSIKKSCSTVQIPPKRCSAELSKELAFVNNKPTVSDQQCVKFGSDIQDENKTESPHKSSQWEECFRQGSDPSLSPLEVCEEQQTRKSTHHVLHFLSNTFYIGAENHALLEDLQISFSPSTHPLGLALFDLENIFRNWLKLSIYLATPVFTQLASKNSQFISLSALLEYGLHHWFLNDANKTLFYTLSSDPKHERLSREDLETFVQVVAAKHPALDFLTAEPEYQKRYVETVVIRIIYTLDQYLLGYITLHDFYRFELLQRHDFSAVLETLFPNIPNDECSLGSICLSFPEVWTSLDYANTTSHERFFFSYEQFYVIYYLFSELDTDHDSILCAEDLLRYDQNGLSLRTIERIFHVLEASKHDSKDIPSRMTYEDFIVFLMNEENKTTYRSLKFWFNVVDFDENGFIMYHEMKYFYDDLCERLGAMNQEPVPLENILCQFNDLMHPKRCGEFTLADFIRHRKVSGIFFDLLLNLTKGLAYEFRDPYQARQEQDECPLFSPWDRFALREYCSLVTSQDTEETQYPDVNSHALENPGVSHTVVSEDAKSCLLTGT